MAGKGNAKKDMMILEVYKKWGFSAPTNDIADAVGLGMFGLCCGGEKFTELERKSCSAVLKGQPLVQPRLMSLNSAINCK